MQEPPLQGRQHKRTKNPKIEAPRRSANHTTAVWITAKNKLRGRVVLFATRDAWSAERAPTHLHIDADKLLYQIQFEPMQRQAFRWDHFLRGKFQDGNRFPTEQVNILY